MIPELSKKCDLYAAGSNGLWRPFFEKGDIQNFGYTMSGRMWDDSRFYVVPKVELNPDRKVIYGLTLQVGQGERTLSVAVLNSKSVNVVAMLILNDWTAAHWVGVDEPVLWAQAGFSPQEARDLQILPERHPDRPSTDALEVLAGLRVVL